MYEPIVDDTLAALAEFRVIECMCDGDHTIWKPESTENADRLGWLGAPEAMRDDLDRLRRQPCDLSSLSFTHAHVLDIGGSSLALELSERTFRGEGGLELGVLHTSDQSTLLRQSDRLCPKRALCIVATKSGGTAETFSLFKSFYDQVVRNVGEGGVGEHFVAITDPRSLLGNLARLLGFGDAFLGDPSIRGAPRLGPLIGRDGRATTPAADEAPRRESACDDRRLRSALPALDGPAPQRRSWKRPLRSADRWRASRRPDTQRARHVGVNDLVRCAQGRTGPGDRQALPDMGRRVIRSDLGADVRGGLDKLPEALG